MSSQSNVYNLYDLTRTLPASSSSPSILISSSLSALPLELKLAVAEAVYILPLQEESHYHFRNSPWPRREKQTLSRLSRTSKEWHAISAPLLAKEVVLTSPFLLDLDLLRQHPLVSSSDLVRAVEIGFYDMKEVDEDYLEPVLQSLPHLEVISLTAYDPPYLPILQTAPSVHTLEHELSVFDLLPLEHVTFARCEEGYSRLDGLEIALRIFIQQHSATLKHLSFAEPEIAFVSPSKAAEMQRNLQSIQSLCEEHGIKAILPVVVESTAQWSSDEAGSDYVFSDDTGSEESSEEPSEEEEDELMEFYRSRFLPQQS
ncbi:hypothetical protein JCM8097_008182 [Rhodosporidiobolus ruineniae]